MNRVMEHALLRIALIRHIAQRAHNANDFAIRAYDRPRS